MPTTVSDAFSSVWYDAIRRRPYMPDWIEDAARRLKEEKDRRRKNGEAREAIAGALKANGGAIFETLRGYVKKDVELFNAHFPEATKKLTMQPLGNVGFRIQRQYDPDFLLDVELQRDQTTITWERKGRGVKAVGVLELQYDVSGGHLVKDGDKITFEEASQRLIEPAIEGLV
jgi:hypothetical protein